jgi:hypothetical protein
VHLLEHIVDDGAAVREIWRVLRPGGWAILHSPVDRTLPVTDEGPDLPPAERARRFGQADHLRMYGRDYAARLAHAGFEVTAEDYPAALGPVLTERHALVAGEHVYLCRKPAATGDGQIS